MAGQGQRLTGWVGERFGVMVALAAKRAAGREVDDLDCHGVPVWWVLFWGARPVLDGHRGQCVSTAGPRRDESYSTAVDGFNPC